VLLRACEHDTMTINSRKLLTRIICPTTYICLSTFMKRARLL